MAQKRMKKVALDSLVLDPSLQFFPDWDEEKLGLTIKQIEDEGDVRVPIVIDENNRVLDGHQRLKAAKATKIKEVSCEVVTGLEEVDKLGYAIGQANRRHLTRAEIRQAAEQAVLKLHEYSDIRIAHIVGIVTDKTVRAIRVKLVGESKIPDHDSLIGLGGSRQSGTKVTKKGTEQPADQTAGSSPAGGDGQQKEKGDEQPGGKEGRLEEGKGAEKATPAGQQEQSGGHVGQGGAERAGESGSGRDQPAERRPDQAGQPRSGPEQPRQTQGRQGGRK